ncbi:hypothetical protein DF118_03505 [Burkholderia stagnalis]|nr:hypothetical protein DF163_06640 [Burkholderia stagnalis]RQQ38680.1 hypothetical protein DF149_03440 [Burkholderia stagnalis]RQQ50313.1 hypothetical protein DF162_12475 [Burkholderia stagnalis]RQY18286.1 hypothetical protein DF118_03505 [Burkholderia stagnalis]RQY44481.1 hypothetical protein DF116_03440 [Burkholderia stagnalis]
MERAGNIKIESVDHAADLLRIARERVAALTSARERLQARAGDFQAATDRLDQLMSVKKDELIASAREGREPDYREIDAQLSDVRAVLANYRDEQVNVPAAIATLERQLDEAQESERVTLDAIHDFMSRRYREAFADARNELVEFARGPLRAKLEQIWAMYQLERVYGERHEGDRWSAPGMLERTATTEGELDRYLGAFETLSGVGLREVEISKIASEHVEEMKGRGIDPRFGFGAPARAAAPNSIQIHIAQHVLADYEADANRDAVQADHPDTEEARARRMDAIHERRMDEVMKGEGAL